MAGDEQEHDELLRLRLDAGVHAPARARRAVADLDAVAASQRADLELLVSEAVTNAVKHGKPDRGGSVELRVLGAGRCLRVEVRDFGAAVPAPREPDTTGGYGLRIVEAIATRWGSAPGELWFELAR